jgi:hypothetical protein
MPAIGAIPTGHIVYVDDGGCPLGQVKEVTGGSLTPDIPRRIRCVDHPTTAPTVTPERRSEIAAAAQACIREHPTVERYQVDRFGRVTATYRMAGGQTADTAPFFACVGARQSARARPAPESSGRWPATLPLPDDVVLRAPGQSVIPFFRPLSGRWAGTSGDGPAAAGLVVEELWRASATVVLSFFSDGLGQTRRRKAELQAETRTLIVEGIAPGSSVRYQLQPDDSLLMQLEDGSGQLVTKALRRVP